MRFQTSFVTSAFALASSPRWELPEVALAGRSNVGKSSLLNALAGAKGVARTSRTPGRTQSLNFFNVDDRLALVDLPGYGYARMPQAQAELAGRLIQSYLQQRANLRAIVLLADCRRGLEDDDLAVIEAFEHGPDDEDGQSRRRMVVVAATKCDKLRNSERRAAAARFTPHVAETIFCSSVSGEGIDQLRKRLLAIV